MATRDVLPSVEAEAEPPGEFERLRRFIRYHLGGFTLGLVRVNDPRQRDGAIASLTDALRADGARLVRVDLANHHPADLRQAVLSDADARAALHQDRPHAALAIVGLEYLLEAEAGESGRPPFAAALNAERDALPAVLPAPIILFLTDHAMDRLDLAAPDFFDWYSGIFRLRPAGAPATTELPARQLAEPRPPYPAALSPETLGARLELLEERRAELARAGPEARLRLAQVLKEIGELYAGLPEFHNRQLAMSFLKQAAGVFHEEGQKAEEAAALEQLGEVCYWIDDYRQSTRRYEAAWPIYREIGARLGEANALTAFGDLSLAGEAYASAREWFEQASHIYRQIGERHWQTYIALRLSQALLALGEIDAAVDVLEAGAQLAREIDGQPNLRDILQALAQIKEQPGGRG